MELNTKISHNQNPNEIKSNNLYKFISKLPKELNELLWEFEGNTIYKQIYNKLMFEIILFNAVELILDNFSDKNILENKSEQSYKDKNYSQRFLQKIKLIHNLNPSFQETLDLYDQNLHKDEMNELKEFLNSGFLSYFIH